MEIHNTIKIGDGLDITIEGFDTVLFMGKTGEYLTLMGVYFI
jgi:hypothetical protein